MDQTKQVLRTDHAAQQAVERYGFAPNFGQLIQKIQRDEAKLVALVEQGRLVYDVPVRHARNDVRMRVVVDSTRSYVVTILPNEFDATKRIAAKEKQRKKAFFRGFEHDDESCNTVGS